MEKYYIYCRYEFISSEGKKWCKWFRVDKAYNDEESAKSQIEIISSTSKEIDKSTKMKHEYEIRLQDETLIPQIKMRRPKGRPKKFSTDELDKIIKVLNKNGQVKIDDIVAPYLYNDDEAQKYIQEHLKDKNKWIRYWYDNNDVLYLILKNNSEKVFNYGED